MRRIFFWAVLLAAACVGMAYAGSPAPSNGVGYPVGWQNWSAIGVAHRADNNTVRLIVGNDIAVQAARSGQTNPWPDGAVLGKVVWKAVPLDAWDSAAVPGELVHAEFMFKDTGKYAASYGWGWGRWLGMEQKPFDKGSEVCTSCHTPVRDRDWVFTRPAVFPK